MRQVEDEDDERGGEDRKDNGERENTLMTFNSRNI
jgi:hypothetical protein